MVTVFRCGQMELAMKDTGGTTRRAAKESSGTLMATFLRASGRTTRRMAMVFMYT